MSAKSTASRIPALDFTKGALVLFMVLYHWLNYFITAQGAVYKYLRFLTPSFIFITGFLISQVYLARLSVPDSRLSWRLAGRGLKLLVIFVILNAGISLLLANSYNGQILFWHMSLRNIVAIYVTGNVWVVANGKAAAFYILVPISYLLLLSALLLPIYRLHKYVFHFVCALSFLAIPILLLLGVRTPNLELLAIGLLGVVSGFIPIRKIDAWSRHLLVLAIAYLGYLVAATVWDVNYWLQLVGVYLTLMLIYSIGIRSSESGFWTKRVILLGKYSLLGYIAQIAILQLLHRWLGHATLTPTVLILTCVLAFALTMASVELTDSLRERALSVDRVYKAVFA